MYPYQQSFLSIDITGESTDISLVNNDILMGTSFFPYGKNFFIREISVGTRTSQEEATTLFGMYLRGELEEKRHTQIESIIERSRAEWGLHFVKVLTELAKTGRPDPTVFFTTDGDVSRFFEILMKEVSTGFFPGEGAEMKYIDTETMANFVSFESGVVRDPFLAIEALFSKK